MQACASAKFCLPPFKVTRKCHRISVVRKAQAGSKDLVWNRRSTLGLALGLLTSSKPCAASEQVEAANNIEFGTVNGSLRACPTSVNPNCVSTRSTNVTYSPAWRSSELSVDDSVDKIMKAVPRVCPGAELTALRPEEGNRYLAYSVDGPFGKDTLEFLIKPSTTSGRNWEGDAETPIVTYRAIAGKVLYIYPIQQPITDMGAQKKRMDAIRQSLGWKIIGCELLECYS